MNRTPRADRRRFWTVMWVFSFAGSVFTLLAGDNLTPPLVAILVCQLGIHMHEEDRS